MSKKNRKRKHRGRNKNPQKGETPMGAVNTGTPNGDGKDGTNKGAGHKQESTKPPHWVNYVEAGCAVALVFITGFYTYYTAGQLHKLKRSTEAAEGANNIAYKELVASNRTWIEISLRDQWKLPMEAPKLMNLVSSMKILDVPVTFIDIGKAPVKQISGDFNIDIVDKNKQPELSYVPYHNRFTEHILFPGKGEPDDAIHFGPDNKPQEISKPLHEDLINGEKYLVVYGMITFYDDFGEHWVRYCQPLAFRSGNYLFRNCTDYNNTGDGAP